MRRLVQAGAAGVLFIGGLGACRSGGDTSEMTVTAGEFDIPVRPGIENTVEATTVIRAGEKAVALCFIQGGSTGSDWVEVRQLDSIDPMGYAQTYFDYAPGSPDSFTTSPDELDKRLPDCK